MVGINIGARLGKQALPVLAHAVFQLLGTGRMAEVGRRAADVMDITLEAGKLYQQLCFTQNRFMAARLNDTSLMRMNSAEGTAAEAASAAYQAELNLLQRCYAALGVVARVPLTHIRQIVDSVHLLHRQREDVRILYDIFLLSLLDYDFAIKRVLLLALQLKGSGKFLAVVLDSLPARKLHIFIIGQTVRQIRRTADIMQILSAGTACQIVGNFHNLLFAHAVNQKVRTARLQNRRQQLVFPVVEMHKTAQAGFNTADNYRHIGPQLLDELRINGRSMVGTLSHRTACGIFVDRTLIFGCRITAQHGVKVAAGNKHAQSRLAQLCHIFCFIPTRLAQHSYLVALRLQHTADYCRTEGGMVYIGIAADKQKVKLLPATLGNFLSGNR